MLIGLAGVEHATLNTAWQDCKTLDVTVSGWHAYVAFGRSQVGITFQRLTDQLTEQPAPWC
jgi:hypothetical protein